MLGFFQVRERKGKGWKLKEFKQKGFLLLSVKIAVT
jgi:hypothetical protein